MSKEVKDHLGNIHENTIEMCKYYNVRYAVYLERIYNNWGLRRALTTKDAGWCGESEKSNSKVVDYLGIGYKTAKEMCEHYNVNYQTFIHRRKAKRNMRDCLKAKEVADHLGNTFETVQEMCEYYNISYGTFKQRKFKGCNLKECLAPLIRQTYHGKQITDHLGNSFESVKDMCSFYNLSYMTYYMRKRRGCNLQECLMPVQF